MKCQGCGAEVADDAAFCPACGQSLKGAPVPAGSAAASLRSVADKAGAAADTEEELWSGGFSPKAMVGTWLACVVLTLGLAILAFLLSVTGIGAVVVSTLICLLWVYAAGAYVYRRLGVEYRLTSQRFMHMSGILVRVTDRIEVIDIDDVSFRQGIVARALGVGTITLVSSDRTHPQLVLPGIDDVQRVAGLIDDVRRTERRRRGIHIEQV